MTTSRHLKGALSALILGGALPFAAAAQNIVVNGGFETGDLTGFNQFGGILFVDQPFNAPEGKFVLESTEGISSGFLIQFLPTVPGQSYTVSFFADVTNPLIGAVHTDNFIHVLFGGVKLFDQVIANSTQVFQPFSFTTGPAATGSTPLVFELSDLSGSVQLDAISVTAVGTVTTTPEPATVTLVATGLMGLAGFASRKRKPAIEG